MVTSALSAFPELMNDPDSITVCDGLSCRLMGAGYVQRLLRDRLGSDRVCTSPCQNACSSAPIVQVRGALYGGLQEASLKALAQRLEQPERAS
jgi:NADH:ubiquinone oxidoreductase subunit E